MEQLDSDVPLPPRPFTVGIIFNLKKGKAGEAEDEEAELDGIETVRAIASALEKIGAKTVLLEADGTLPGKLAENKIDIAFNIAEGISGRGREAQVPALLESMNIPYSGSDVTTMSLTLDKALCKRLLKTYGVKTPGYAVVGGDMKLPDDLRYPVIVKPNAEGSGKGIGDVSVVGDKAALEALCRRNIGLYNEQMLVEEYIAGREFTVGIVGNGESKTVFRPMEIVFGANAGGENGVYSYKIKQNYEQYVKYECPARLDAKTEKRMMKIAGDIFDDLSCRDLSRIDFRMSEKGEIYFLEINPLPGLAPGYSDYPMLAAFNGVEYEGLIAAVFNAAAKRCGLNGKAGV